MQYKFDRKFHRKLKTPSMTICLHFPRTVLSLCKSMALKDQKVQIIAGIDPWTRPTQAHSCCLIALEK